MLGNVNEGSDEHPALLIGVAQLQNQTAWPGATTQMMMGQLLELMTEAARHEEDDFEQTIQPADFDTIHTALAEIVICDSR